MTGQVKKGTREPLTSQGVPQSFPYRGYCRDGLFAHWR